jgi:hypothetical protein
MSLKLQIKRLESKVAELNAQNLKLRKKAKYLTHSQKVLRGRLEARPKQTITAKKKIVEDVLGPFFSKTQIRTFLRGDWDRIKNWTQDDICQALTLRLLSRRAYNYLRNSKVLPLPGVSTLVTFFKDFRIQEGYLNSVAKLLRAKILTMTDLEKVAIASFDEIHLKSDISYDKHNDQIIGPHREANVLMLRGLFAKWKLPIWYGYDQALAKDVLLDIIKKVEAEGIDIAGVVCDQGGKNLGLAKKMGIDHENTVFDHPSCPGQKIAWFYDVPHILKNLRTAFLRRGFKLPSGTVIGKRHLQKLFDKLGSDVSVAWKLSDRHLNVKDQDCQTVSLAAQLFSSSTALAIKHIFPDDPEMLEVADFIQLVDNWFDTLNSRRKYDKVKAHRCGYRLHLEKQQATLEKALEVFEVLQVEGWKTKMPWQKGLLTSTKSMLYLYDSLKEKYGILYLVTCRCNQDVLENTFSRLRVIRGHALSFGALELNWRLRDHILGGCDNLSVKTASVHCPEDDNFMLTQDVSLDLLAQDTFEPVTPSEDDLIIDDFDGILAAFSPDEPSTSVSQEQGYVYLSGYLARVCGEESHFRTKNDEKNPSLFTSSGWMDDKNTAAAAGGIGLCYPSKALTADIAIMEKEFVAFHEGEAGLSRAPGVVQRFSRHLGQKFPQYSTKLITKFSKTRTMIRMSEMIKDLHCRHAESLRSKRKKIENAY